jgi:DNA invertase Pin-like site-specific DNA recombinase
VAAQEISDRTKAGMVRAKAKGINIGRPRLEFEIRQKIVQRVSKGETPYAIAKALGVDRHTVVKYMGASEPGPPSHNACFRSSNPVSAKK